MSNNREQRVIFVILLKLLKLSKPKYFLSKIIFQLFLNSLFLCIVKILIPGSVDSDIFRGCSDIGPSLGDQDQHSQVRLLSRIQKTSDIQHLLKRQLSLIFNRFYIS